MCVCVCVCMHACVHAYMRTCVYACMHTCVYACVRAGMHVRTVCDQAAVRVRGGRVKERAGVGQSDVLRTAVASDVSTVC